MAATAVAYRQLSKLLYNRRTADYTLAITDAGGAVEMNLAGANTLTIPPNSSVAFAIGDVVYITQYGAGATTIAPGAGVTLRSYNGLLTLSGQYASASATKVGTDEWYVWGGTAGNSVLTVTPSANENDYTPTGLQDSTILCVNASASIKFTGLGAGVNGKEITICNKATDYLLWLENENTASTAANRFKLPKGLPAFLMPGDSITMIYETDRWEVSGWPFHGEGMGLTFFSDFVESTSGGLTSTVSGTGASNQASTYLINTTERPLGVGQIDTGTTATGRATLGNAGSGDIIPTLGPALSVVRLAAEAANSGTETWQLISGFADSAGGTFNDGVAWNLRWNNSAAEWSQDRLANAVATRSVTGSPTPDTNYIWLVVFVNPGWTRADFIYSTDSIAFTKADSPTTGIPGNTRFTSWVAASMIKSVGTTQRNCSIDLAGYRVDYVRG